MSCRWTCTIVQEAELVHLEKQIGHLTVDTLQSLSAR